MKLECYGISAMRNTWKEFITLYKNPLSINEKFMDKFIEENLKPDNVTLRKQESIFLCATVPSNLKLFYDDYITDKKDLYKLITLLILETLTQGCVKEYNSIKRDILNVYGYQHIFLLRNLETIGLIKERADAIGLIKEKVNIKNMIMELTYPQILNKLGLINPDANNPKNKFKDCSYIFQGYCPIILRLIEKAIELDPQFQDALYAIAAAYKKLGDYHKTLEYLEKLLQVEPQHIYGRALKKLILQKYII